MRIYYLCRRCCEMIQRLRALSQKALCVVVTLMLLCAPAPVARVRSTMVVLTTGSARAVVDGRPVTMLIPPVTDQASQQTLVPIEFIARQFGFGVSSVPQSTAVTLSSPEHMICVTPGSLEALVDGHAVGLSVTPRGLLGEVLVAAADVQLLLSVQYSRGLVDGQSVFTWVTPDPVVVGPVDVNAVT